MLCVRAMIDSGMVLRYRTAATSCQLLIRFRGPAHNWRSSRDRSAEKIFFRLLCCYLGKEALSPFLQQEHRTQFIPPHSVVVGNYCNANFRSCFGGIFDFFRIFSTKSDKAVQHNESQFAFGIPYSLVGQKYHFSANRYPIP